MESIVKVCLFKHTDMDGESSEIVLGLNNINVLKSVGCDYSNVDKLVLDFINKKEYLNFDKTYIVDISVSNEVAKKIEEVVKEGAKFKLIDHHKTALDLNKYFWAKVILFDRKGKPTCGTKLLFEDVFGPSDLYFKELRCFIELVQEWDTFSWTKTNNLEAVRLNDLFEEMGAIDFRKSIIEKMTNNKELFSEEENIKIDVKTKRRIDYFNKIGEKLVKRKMNLLKDEKQQEFNVGIVSVDDRREISLLGHFLYTKFDKLDFIAILNNLNNNVSLRTNKDIDLSEIAKLNFNGGGHPSSAGCDLDTFMDKLNISFRKGREDVAVTVFVPSDCVNNCEFCTSKREYKKDRPNIENIKKSISMLNKKGFKSFVFTGGEPFADLDTLKELINLIDNDKVVYINTTLPKDRILDTINYINTEDRIKGVSISRHDNVLLDNLAEDSYLTDIKKEVRINSVLTTDSNVSNVIDRFSKFKDISLNFRVDYRYTTKSNLKILDGIGLSLFNNNNYKMIYSGGSDICQDFEFIRLIDGFKIQYHKGLEYSSFEVGNTIIYYDLIIKPNGKVYYDWDDKDLGIKKLLI
ncbi:radical SAM protein [Clostridioides sp. ZZV14-6045]|uniref:radical SAM protein n=1 Tax=Clostridioides sp. ZZV14-6045 TaxID=2811489 RepID=UPI001D114EE2|nr:radical SAM protein [Clostridioides sp. ZZV14-6045]